MTKVFVDGSAGTTGLRIYERLSSRKDIEFIRLEESVRKDPAARKDALNSADIAFLCLPDAAAIEAVGMIENSNTAVIDTSTAHRTNDAWAYGFPELSGYREKIEKSKRIANPGCHASGFVSLVAPLVENKILDKKSVLHCFSLTGYSGGGKKMIAEYEGEGKNELIAPRTYGLTQAHKHLPEMAKICSLEYLPLFSPVVSSYYSGMEVVVQLAKEEICCSIKNIKDIYKSYYTSKIVRFVEDSDESGFLSGSKMSGRDDMEISVFGNDDRITLVSRFDNLGKGASGAAIQNMNIIMGSNEGEGLNIPE